MLYYKRLLTIVLCTSVLESAFLSYENVVQCTPEKTGVVLHTFHPITAISL